MIQNAPQRLLLQSLYSSSVPFQNDPLDLISGCGTDRMGNVPVFAIGSSAAWHGNEQALFPIDNLDVMDNEFVINGDGNDGAHLALGFHLSYSYVCDLHVTISPSQRCPDTPLNLL